MVKQQTIRVVLSSDESDNPQSCLISTVKLAKERNKWITCEEWEASKKKAKKAATTTKKEEAS